MNFLKGRHSVHAQPGALPDTHTLRGRVARPNFPATRLLTLLRPRGHAEWPLLVDIVNLGKSGHAIILHQPIALASPHVLIERKLKHN
ncbi:hypothetical protein Rhopal_004290-T1 [Rhodotorula paludigena]|uniref:Uncharacterized protein n=1 Tax=Rhodotorula paludigena TaxID=86838 RepID=A0AAV5GNZ9_9BASI|nr:hypothetical protein Rhopal_004290-T1 [Rhodotorula paludigena]